MGKSRRCDSGPQAYGAEDGAQLAESLPSLMQSPGLDPQHHRSQVCWCVAAISEPERQRQENQVVKIIHGNSELLKTLL